MRFRATWAAVAVTAALLTACGGGSIGPIEVDLPISRVKVAGDSLADSGTFGGKFTVQGTAAMGAGSNAIWPELVAADYGATLCPHYQGVNFTPNANCSNYAIAGGRINYPSQPQAPLSITQQLHDMGAAGYNVGELVLIDGGGNDAADLVTAFLAAASTDNGVAFATLLSSKLPPATVQALIAQGQSGLAQAGGAYMQALAEGFADTIRTQVVQKGAQSVVVLNMPDVTLTPKFSLVLAAVAASQGQETANQITQLARGWIQAFNTTLETALAGEKRVRVADFYTRLSAMVANASQYKLTNVTTPACPITGLDDNGLPNYNLLGCTAANLSASPAPESSSGGTNWWESYLFSDDFHPTPYGHALMKELITETLR